MALGNHVALNEPDVDELLDDWTSLRLYSATSYAGSYSVIHTFTLVAGTTVYERDDTAGTAATWYRKAYFNTGSSQESALSAPWPADAQPAVTLQTLTQQAAYRARLYGRPKRQHTFPGPSGTTTGAGSATTTVCSSFISDNWTTADFYGWYLRGTSGTESGNERDITSFAKSTGTFTHTAFATGVGNTATFELYGMLTGSEWRECVQDALLDFWEPVTWPVDGITSQTEYPLPWFIANTSQIQGLYYRSGTVLRQHQLVGGADYLAKSVEGGGVTLYFPGGLGANNTYFVEARRHPQQFLSDTDTLLMSEQNQRIIWLTAAMRAVQRISEVHGGTVEDRRQRKAQLAELNAERLGLVRELGLWNTNANVRQGQIVGMGGRQRWSGTSQYYR